VRSGNDPNVDTQKPETAWHARHGSFDLHAGRTVYAGDRAGLERLCHYLLRPPLALIPKPQVNLLIYQGILAPRARHRARRDPRGAPGRGVRPGSRPAPAPPAVPRISTIGPPGKAAPSVSDGASANGADARGAPAEATGPPPHAPSGRYRAWAELLRRIFEIDVLACACGGRLRFIATIEDPPVVERILRHLGLPTVLPQLAPARSPSSAP